MRWFGCRWQACLDGKRLVLTRKSFVDGKKLVLTRKKPGKRTLGRKTKRTNLGRECGRGTDFTTRRTEVDDLDLGGIELGS